MSKDGDSKVIFLSISVPRSCAKIFCKQERFFNIIKIQGRKRISLHIPENSFNEGWTLFARNLEAFLSTSPTKPFTILFREVSPDTQFKDVVKRSKWVADDLCKEKFRRMGDLIVIDDTGDPFNVLLHRSIVDYLPEELKEFPTLSEIRKWASINWQHDRAINIYELGWSKFLFEFSSGTDTEKAISGNWWWRKFPMHLAWWTPSCLSNSPSGSKDCWIRIVGLPLHLWDQCTFEVIGDACGGWLATEEETSLSNHLKWARIKVKGDGSSIPKELKLQSHGEVFTIQLWAEIPPKIQKGNLLSVVGTSKEVRNGQERSPRTSGTSQGQKVSFKHMDIPVPVDPPHLTNKSHLLKKSISANNHPTSIFEFGSSSSSGLSFPAQPNNPFLAPHIPLSVTTSFKLSEKTSQQPANTSADFITFSDDPPATGTATGNFKLAESGKATILPDRNLIPTTLGQELSLIDPPSIEDLPLNQFDAPGLIDIDPRQYQCPIWMKIWMLTSGYNNTSFIWPGFLALLSKDVKRKPWLYI